MTSIPSDVGAIGSGSAVDGERQPQGRSSSCTPRGQPCMPSGGRNNRATPWPARPTSSRISRGARSNKTATTAIRIDPARLIASGPAARADGVDADDQGVTNGRSLERDVHQLDDI